MPRINEGGDTQKGKTYPEMGVPAKRMEGAKATNKAYGKGPVSVYVAPDIVPEFVNVAIKRWNKEAGFSLFKIVKEREKADIVIQAPAQNTTESGITHANTGQEGIYTESGQGIVNLDPGTFTKEGWAGYAEGGLTPEQLAPMRTELLPATIQHELGHAIGLAHPGPESNPYLTVPKTHGEGYQSTGYTGVMGATSAPTQSEIDLVAKLRGGMPVPAHDHPLSLSNPRQQLAPFQTGVSPNRQIMGDHINVGGGGSGGSSGSGSGGSSGSGSGSSGSSGSSGGSSTPSAPAVDPVVAQKESMFATIYAQLWGEPATKAYLESAAKSGMNSWEFQAHEMSKPAFANTKTYQDKAQETADLIASLGIGR